MLVLTSTILNITTLQEAFTKIRYVFLVSPNHRLRLLQYLGSTILKISRDMKNEEIPYRGIEQTYLSWTK